MKSAIALGAKAKITVQIASFLNGKLRGFIASAPV